MLRSSIFMVSLVLLIGGCTTTTKQVYSDSFIKDKIEHTVKKNTIIINEPIETQKKEEKQLVKNEISQTIQIEKSKEIAMNQALMDFYNEWKNVKYRFGGNSKKGIDCSAFTQRIYKEKFDTNIPRSTRTQVKVGKEIKKSELELGDLVFFKTGKIDRHVGVYMGNGDFMHASIKGVKFTKLDKPFYKRKYWTSRRIID